MAKKNEKVQEPVAEPAKEKFLLISESAANQLLQALTRLTWADANPLIQFVQASMKPVEEPKAVTEPPVENKEQAPEKKD